MRKLLMICAFLSMISMNAASADGFSVDGNRLLDANGNEFIMRGVNYAYAWFRSTMNQSLPAIAQAGANTVRIVLSDGGKWSKIPASEISQLLEICTEQELVAVLEVHDATGSDDKQTLLRAANYFVGLKDLLAGKEDRVIINIANEWYGSWRVDPWAQGNAEAIGVLRDAGFTHTIMIDGAGYGQYPASIHQKGKDVFDADPLGNTMFSIHMYEYAGSDANTIKDNIDNTLSQGLALCIGEFGFRHTNGDVDEQYILDYCEEKSVGWLAWSWHGNGGGVEYLDLANDASGSSLSEWGHTIVNGSNGLKQTAVKASIFEQTDVVRNTQRRGTGSINLRVLRGNADSHISISLWGVKNGRGRLKIFDSKGALVWSQSSPLSAGEQHIGLPAQVFSPGAYVVTVASGEAELSTKMILNR